MKLPEFNHAERKWDRFREFYNEIGVGVWFYQNTNPFIMLETGEFFLNRGRFAPDMRKFYKDLNITIFGSTDPAWSSFLNQRSARILTPDNQEVTKAWLTQGRYQTLIFDHDHNMVVRASDAGSWNSDQTDKRIPTRLRPVAGTYWAAAGEPPIGRAPIAVSEPDPLSKADREHVNGIIAACKAWNTLSEEANGKMENQAWSPTVHKPGSYERMPNPYYINPAPFTAAELLNLEYANLTWGEKKRIAQTLVKPRRKITEVTHLIIT